MICHLNKIVIVRSWFEISFNQGINNHVNPNASNMASHETKTDSLRNWIIISFLCAPTTFRIPISLARNVDLAVQRFI